MSSLKEAIRQWPDCSELKVPALSAVEDVHTDTLRDDEGLVQNVRHASLVSTVMLSFTQCHSPYTVRCDD